MKKEDIKKGLHKAYGKCSENSFFGEAFGKGVEFAEKFHEEKLKADQSGLTAKPDSQKIEYSSQQVLEIVDNCFHAFASSFREDAKEMVEASFIRLSNQR